MEDLIKQVGKENLILIGIGIILVLISILLIRKMLLKKYRKQELEIENKLSAIKSLPLQYRLGRVQNIAKNAPEIMSQYELFEKRYDELIHMQKDVIAISLNEVDERIFSKKVTKVSKKLKELMVLVEQFENDAKSLLNDIETVTEVENVQRMQIIRVKEKYRNSQQYFDSARYKLEGAIDAIGNYFNDLDERFVMLEGFMNQQKYDEAKRECDRINEKVDYINANIRDLPTYLSLAKNYIPTEIEKIQNRIINLKANGYSLVRINAEQRVIQMQDHLDKILEDIEHLDLNSVGENLNTITNEITQLNNEFEIEESSQQEFIQIYDEIFSNTESLREKYNQAMKEFEKLKTLYVITDESMDLAKEAETLEDIITNMTYLKETIRQGQFSYQEIVGKLKELQVDTDSFDMKLQHFNSKRDEMYLCEKRALDELENINIVLLEIKSQIKNKQLPVINESYKDYIADSYRKANEIQYLCKSRPIILETLTKQVDVARDIIYKLYDNIHNLIVTADMVEEAIVFGNRYRSSFLEVNTELTKAEVLYRNGEYTKALSTAVDIIEKIKPGSYERLITKNQKASL